MSATSTLAPRRLVPVPTSPPREVPLWWPILLGCVIALAQAAAILALTGERSLAAAYERLAGFDSHWYASIVAEGYRYQPELLTQPGYQANLGFFPGYPLAARALMSVLPLGPEAALVATAQLACASFWIYFLLLLRRWRIPAGVSRVGVLAVALHPGAFFLVVGYSESLFVMLMLGFLFWSGREGRAAWGIAALHGVALTATRFVGLAVVGSPVVKEWLTRRRLSQSSLTLVGVACLGIVGFFAWCQVELGRWDLYLRVNEVGWNTRADYLAVLWPMSYRPAPLFGPDGAFCPDRFSRNFVPLTTLLFAGLLWREYRTGSFGDGRWRARAGLYLCAGLLFYLAIGGKAGNNMGSMVRIALPVYVVLVLAGVHQFGTSPQRETSPRLKWGLGALGGPPG